MKNSLKGFTIIFILLIAFTSLSIDAKAQLNIYKNNISKEHINKLKAINRSSKKIKKKTKPQKAPKWKKWKSSNDQKYFH